jgi:MFS family permease
MIYFTAHFGLKSGVVSALIIVPGLGALAGMIGGGRVSERLLERGRLDARVVLPAVALIVSVPFLGLGLLTTSAWLGVLLLTIGILIVSAAVAPIDAARLDIVVPQLWGRAEAGRMALRSAFEGSAPPLFGALSVWLGGKNPTQGLEWTFLLMLAPMIAASLFAFPARKTYPRDVATAAASTTRDRSKDPRS